jgi:Flp pilus assembly protein TadD
MESTPALPSASRALLEQSRSGRASGSYAAAASSVERALRIDPNNAALWVELGEIKLDENDPVQAQMMARKALTLAGSDQNVVARAHRLVDRAACVSGRC